ncbi:Regulator of chromosome condensation family with FYVE zinc finger domain-containing protein [Perilla frutescens var. frutescens]|nr:Regulator of chromosome condensation family with FYVE zinc finger domain-containing protein [Perilla frutescens var. frutescens]
MSIAASHDRGGSGVVKSLISSGLDGRFKIDGRSNADPVSPVRTNIQVKESASDTLQYKNVPITRRTSIHDSVQDNCDALGVVYTWGRLICDEVSKMGSEEANVLLPMPLQCNGTLDVDHIACGVRHAAIVTGQGQVFTWGQESGGELGHGVKADVTQPRLLESLSSVSVGYVACGEFHTCAVTIDGELYTWGDGTHNAGLLGHGTDLSHWIPKRVSGPLEGLQVTKVACGPWHTALITSTGQLFTFGDGTFGVLGHGSREDVSYPRKVESLSGLRTIAVACGVWHTAAVVEIVATQSSPTVSSGKLFTWGDGDKSRLGHGDMYARLMPTCVHSIVDHDFLKVACGERLTVGLTTTGRVFTMGIPVYGQLGNPQSDGKLPCMVKDKLSGVFVEEIACGMFHVAVLTSKNEVYTWGNGMNGRLGHGDTDDRNRPTLVEAIKDKHVKYIACGSNYSVAVCHHKLAYGAEQSHCSTCRLAFGFTRKRHNCYNCGVAHCHACSSRKAIGAALAPDPTKSCRVCDSCFAKLSKVAEAGSINPGNSGENKDKLSPIRWFDSAAEEQILMPRKHSHPLSATPVLSSSESLLDGLLKNNGLLRQEVINLRIQLASLKNQCYLQQLEFQKSPNKVEEAIGLAGEECAEHKAAKDSISS